jgi:hypothetical protein
MQISTADSFFLLEQIVGRLLDECNTDFHCYLMFYLTFSSRAKVERKIFATHASIYLGITFNLGVGIAHSKDVNPDS